MTQKLKLALTLIIWTIASLTQIKASSPTGDTTSIKKKVPVEAPKVKVRTIVSTGLAYKWHQEVLISRAKIKTNPAPTKKKL